MVEDAALGLRPHAALDGGGLRPSGREVDTELRYLRRFTGALDAEGRVRMTAGAGEQKKTT